MKKIISFLLLLVLVSVSTAILSAGAETDKGITIQDLSAAADDELNAALNRIEEEMRARLKMHIILDKRDLKMEKGTGATLVPEIVDALDDLSPGPFRWNSSEETVATVNDNGQVKAVSTGKSVITCSVLLSNGLEIYANCMVQVYIPVKSIAFIPRALTIVRGVEMKPETQVTPVDATDPGLEFTSSDDSIATVASDGTIKGIEIGECTITASAKDGSGKASVLKVSVRQEVTGIALEAPSGLVAIGKALRITGKVEPNNANNKTIHWESEDEAIATVDKNGTVKGIAIGKTRIKASSSDETNVASFYDIEVIQPLMKISTADPQVILAPETSWKQTLTLEPENATEKSILWQSSDDSIATVDENGTIYGLKAGKCQVAGIAKDGYKASVTVKVDVRNFDYVLTTPEAINVGFQTEESSSIMMGVSNRGPVMRKEENYTQFPNGCVTRINPGIIKPVKPGADKAVVICKVNNRVRSKEEYTIYVAQSAVPADAN